MDDTAAGRLVTLHVRFESQILPRLLGWGDKVRAREPESLRQLTNAEAVATLKPYLVLIVSPVWSKDTGPKVVSR